MSKLVEKFVIPLKHAKCGYSWEYGGKNPYYATCPYCRNQVNIKKYAISQVDVKVRGPNQLVIPESNTGGIKSRNG